MVYRKKDFEIEEVENKIKNLKCPCDEEEIVHKKVPCQKVLDLCPKPTCLSKLINNTCKFSNPPTYQEWQQYVNFNAQALAKCDASCAPINFFYDFRMAYNPADFDLVFGTDGKVTSDPVTKDLIVTSQPFNFFALDGSDHVKWLRYYKSTFPLCNTHEVLFEAEMAAQQFIPPVNVPPATTGIPTAMTSRIRNVNDDIRLASAALNLIDPETWMVFDFFLSNTAIYAFYERLPFGKAGYNGNIVDNPVLGNYASFSNAIWVARRSGVNPLDDFSKLAIGIHRGKGIVTWYVDDTPVFSINTIGFRAHDEYRLLDHGGDEKIVDVKSVRFGFGTFSLLDMALPNNYSRDYVGDATGPPPPPFAREIAQSALARLYTFAGAYYELYPDPLTGANRIIVNPPDTFAIVNPTGTQLAFGQGAALKIKYLRVYSRADGESLEVSSVNH